MGKKPGKQNEREGNWKWSKKGLGIKQATKKVKSKQRNVKPNETK